MHLNIAQILEAAEALYGADADHLARNLLVGLLLRDAVSLEDVNRTIERGLATYSARHRRLLAGLPAGEDSGRPAVTT